VQLDLYAAGERKGLLEEVLDTEIVIVAAPARAEPGAA
jgi:hypothetical protein